MSTGGRAGGNGKRNGAGARTELGELGALRPRPESPEAPLDPRLELIALGRFDPFGDDDLDLAEETTEDFWGTLASRSAVGKRSWTRRSADGGRAAAAAEYQARRSRQAGRAELVVCRGIDVRYGQVQVLFGVDFEVAEGEMVALLGTNGAGKSTLLRTISGLTSTSSGAVVFDGEDITNLSPEDCASLGIVQAPGGRGVFPGLTVAENLRLATWMWRSEKEWSAEATERVLEYFPALRARIDEPAGNLSGGEQQMLMLSQAFLAQPRLLMIDELSLGLAPVVVEQLLEIVRAIHRNGTTVILVEQSVNVALSLAERAVFMEKGEVRFSGPTSELLSRDDILHSVFLRGAASAAGLSGGGLDPAPVVPARARRTEGERRETVLDVRNVGKSYGGIHAVRDVSLTLEEGAILGVIGANGAGKTTFFDIVSGFVRPDEGDVHFDGADVTQLGPDERGRRGLCRSFQDAALFPSLTVAENVAVALERHLESRSVAMAALRLPNVRSAEAKVRARVARLLELFGLGDHRDKFVRELSTGSRRIVDLACVMASDPKVLLLDEPSSGVAQRETEELGPLLVRVNQETGCAMLVIEHDMPLVTSISHELLALELGRVLRRGLPQDVTEDPAVIASYLGRDTAAINRSGTT